MSEKRKDLSFRNIMLSDGDKQDGISGFRSQNIREKLAQTYFGNSDEAVKPHPAQSYRASVVKKPKKKLYLKKNALPFLALIFISIFIFFILLRYTENNKSLETNLDLRANPAPQLSSLASSAPASALVLVDDFNQEANLNKLGGYYGTFSQTPDEPDQFCLLFFDKSNRIGFNGYSLRLDYSLQSPNSTLNGLWMSLANLDATKYSGLDFFIKGSEDKEYPASLKLQLKNATQTGTYILNNLDSKWQRVYLPFRGFEGLEDLDHLLKLLIIFEKKEGNPKTGTVYIDNLQFVKR